MIVDDALIEKLSNLNKLEFNANEKELIKEDLTKILNFMEQLNELDTEGVEPLKYINEDVNVFREDTVKYYITKAEALENAPIKDSDYIKVPKFVKAK